MRKAALIAIVFLLMSLGQALASDLRRSAVVRAVERAQPAVVNISTEIRSKSSSPFRRSGNPSFDRFFSDFFEGSRPKQYARNSLGSGVIVRDDGYILTNEHVILRASKITVTLFDGRELPARVIGADPSSDLAILKIDADNLPAVRPGKSSKIMIGETVIAIGNPFGLSHTVTTGVVSALHRSFKAEKDRVYTDFIQTDASINPGNSGGALMNIDGELIGITSAIYGQAQGIGFAIPIDRAQRIVENLIAYGKVRHGWIGLRVTNLSAEVVEESGVRFGNGVLITRVFSGSPAAAAGMRAGDVLTKVGQLPVGSADQYRAAIMSLTVGTNVVVSAVRRGQNDTYTIKASELPKSAAESFAWELLGINVVKNGPEIARQYRLTTTRGMVISKVAARSPAGRAGIEPGDMLLAIGDKTLDSIDDFQIACASLRLAQGAIIVVSRKGRAYYLSLRLE
jgi:Do/DeqQ family serine protease